MVFSSLLFLFSYLPFILIGYYLYRERKWQNALLFIGSLYFYAWGEKEKVFVMLGSIIINYFIGIAIEKRDILNRRKLVLAIGIIINLSVLIYFKYSKFIIDNLNSIFKLVGFIEIKDLKYEKLPIGISFYTFQSISYLIDVYRKQVKAQKDFLNLGLYIAFFPQLIAGPIVRYKELASQLINRKSSLILFNEGIRRFVIGLGKKMLLANPIAYYVDEIFILPADQVTASLIWVGSAAFALQLYFDFSGYSDMAIGLGKMFGFKLPENFNYPYISRSVREYWTRWHITLSVWFRDYLYIPLGGSRGSQVRTLFNLSVVFLVTGFWHGSNWNYIIWGAFHGVLMILERSGLVNLLNKLPRVVSHLYFIVATLYGLIIFKYEDLGESYIIQKLLFGFDASSDFFTVSSQTSTYFWILFGVGIVFSLPLFKIIDRVGLFQERSKSKNLFYLTIFLFSVMEMVSDTYNPFIYFRF